MAVEESVHIVNAEKPHLADQPVDLEQLKMVWQEFALQRKNQVAEYHLLKQPFDFEHPQVTVYLSNPVEEPLLQNIKPILTDYLRTKLNNRNITITSVLKELGENKIAYTNKEKLDYLLNKNHILKELKDRLGLDPEF